MGLDSKVVASLRLLRSQREQNRQVREALAKSERAEMLEVDYPALIADPQAWVARIVEFLGEARLPAAKKMAGVVRPELHRSR